MQKPTKIKLAKNPPRLQDINLEARFDGSKTKYESELKLLQRQLLEIQQAYYRHGLRAILVFEGWDAGGKGGAIRRITEKLDPRGFNVHPIGAPTGIEKSHHYLYRFQTRLPKSGTIAIFDRSWYGRVLVERVEGFATMREWGRAYQEINEFERTLSDDGVRVIKLFFHISPNEQLERFKERLNNPYKRWKLTREDIRNREKWLDYEIAINDMFRHTSTVQSPWKIIAGNHKWYARLKVLKILIKQLSKMVDLTPPEIDSRLKKEAYLKLGIRS